MFCCVNAKTPDVPPAEHKRAIVSLVAGDKYIDLWNRLSRPNWLGYADFAEADLILITEPLDKSERAENRSIAWQKLLVLNQPWSARYERILWMDSDIIISKFAENVFDYAKNQNKIGICVTDERLSEIERVLLLEKRHNLHFKAGLTSAIWREDIKNRYLKENLQPKFERIFNTGVMVLTPRLHNDLLLETYENDDFGRSYEQVVLSHKIQERKLEAILPVKFNWGIQETVHLNLLNNPHAEKLGVPIEKIIAFFVQSEIDNGYFFHFYGSMPMMEMLVGQGLIDAA
jgi:hypothetical protein